MSRVKPEEFVKDAGRILRYGKILLLATAGVFVAWYGYGRAKQAWATYQAEATTTPSAPKIVEADEIEDPDKREGSRALLKGHTEFFAEIERQGWDINDPNQVDIVTVTAPEDPTLWSSPRINLDEEVRKRWGDVPYRGYTEVRQESLEIEDRGQLIPYVDGGIVVFEPHPIFRIRSLAGETEWSVIICNKATRGRTP